MATLSLPRRHKIDVDAYHRMAEAGILAPDARVELVDGEILDMVPIGSEHGGRTGRLHQCLLLALAGKAFVTASSPLRIDDFNEPEPDILVLRQRADDYIDAHPTPADVLLAVEVANSSRPFDRTVKAELYARAGVREYWIVDLVERCVEVCRGPSPDGGWASREPVRAGTVTIAALPEGTVDVDALFA